MFSNKKFLNQLEQDFRFLEDAGYVRVEANSFRDETTLTYRSSSLMIALCHADYSDEFGCVIGKPADNYPKQAIAFSKLLSSLDKIPELPKDLIGAIAETARLLRDEFSELIRGDLTLLDTIWAEQEDAENALKECQLEIALNRQTIGTAMILEIPNTREAIGETYLKQFPDHSFEQKTTWVVYTQTADFACDSYEQARDIADQFQ